MTELQGKIDFCVFISVNNANPNGDPLNGNRPRVDLNGYGEITDVCIKRKIRNRFQDFGKEIFVQSDDRNTDDCTSLEKRLQNCKERNKLDKKEVYKILCEKWIDVRSFGQVFSVLEKNQPNVRGPVSIHQAVSLSPVDINSFQITKSVNGKEQKNTDEKSSDTMGTKHMVTFGAYKVMGTVNVQLAEKTGFSQEDAELLKEALMTLFENDTSAARPDGSMEVRKMYWWQHNEKNPKYSSGRIQRAFIYKTISK